MEPKFVITIGRQLGSGGLYVAQKLSESLGIKMFDRELLKEAAASCGLSKKLFENRDERPMRSKFLSMFGLRSTIQGNEIISPDTILNDESLFKIQSDVLHKIAAEGSCVIVGRCADYILRDMPNCYTFFISGNIEDRAKRIMDKKGISFQEAKRFIEHGDRKRAEYYNYYTFKKWGDSSSYDLCIDSSKVGVDNVVEIIKNYINIRIKIQ